MTKTPMQILEEALTKDYQEELDYLKKVGKLHYFNENNGCDFYLLEQMRKHGCERYIQLLEQ